MRHLNLTISDDLNLALDEFETKIAQLRLSRPQGPQVKNRGDLLPALLQVAVLQVSPEEVLRVAGGEKPLKSGEKAAPPARSRFKYR